MAELIDPADPADPIARQFVPDAGGARRRARRSAPTRSATTPTARSKAIVHRYPDRVLLKLTHVCAVYCRFCFRREMVGPRDGPALTPASCDAALAYIARPSGDLGGDPHRRRSAGAARRAGCATLIAALAAIDHVKVVRFHTRVPAVAPERVTADAGRGAQGPAKAIYVALHANHPRELTPRRAPPAPGSSTPASRC